MKTFILAALIIVLGLQSIIAQPDPNLHSTKHLELLNKQIGALDTVDYTLIWRRAELMTRMPHAKTIKTREEKQFHKTIISDLSALIDNEVNLSDYKEVTIAHYYYTRGNYYASINNTSHAVSDYKIALKQDTLKKITKQLNFRLMDMYEYREKYDSAVYYCDQLIESQTEHTGLHCNCEDHKSLCIKKAEFLYKANKFDEVLEYLKELFKQSSKANNINESFCYLSKYRHYYSIIYPSELSKYSIDDLDEEIMNKIIDVMESLNTKVK
ncbi:MAG: hypothetical protein KDD41_03570 [Flavobacteriales bacterium]|nr:hypothetical protein [Flavobacteriales bacterium]